MIVHPEFLKWCGLVPVVDNEIWQNWDIDNTLNITFWKSSGQMQISYINNAAIVLFNVDNYTVDELISLCKGLRIKFSIPTTIYLKTGPGFYGC